MISFRTIHDHVDVSVLAGHFGGGGHAKASGCSLTEEAYKSFVTETFHLEPIREDARRNRYNLKGSSIGALYKNRKNNTFLLYEESGVWVIEQNQIKMNETYSSFLEGENFLKRYFEASLVKDDEFVRYLMDNLRKS